MFVFIYLFPFGPEFLIRTSAHMNESAGVYRATPQQSRGATSAFDLPNKAKANALNKHADDPQIRVAATRQVGFRVCGDILLVRQEVLPK